MNTLLLSGFCVAIVAGIIPLRVIAELVNIGTLMAFIIVCAGVIMLAPHQTQPTSPFLKHHAALIFRH